MTVTEKAWMLTVSRAVDLDDLIFWLDDHPTDDELAKEAFDTKDRYRLMDWLRGVIAVRVVFPCSVHVPVGVVRVLEMLINDYAEVEAAHGESFDTCLTYTEG